MYKSSLKDKKYILKGKRVQVVHVLPAVLKAELTDQQLKIVCENRTPENNVLWGLHRALLANELKGASDGFEQKVIINGLGFKVASTGTKLVFNLGF